MEIDYALTIKAKDIEIPVGLNDDLLFLSIKNNLLNLLEDKNTRIEYFGYAPDNTADNQDNLLNDGIFYRIIAYESDLKINLESDDNTILKSYKNLIENYKPYWTTIVEEKGFIKKETTIELLYQNLI